MSDRQRRQRLLAFMFVGDQGGDLIQARCSYVLVLVNLVRRHKYDERTRLDRSSLYIGESFCDPVSNAGVTRCCKSKSVGSET
jgi:hypothetical protein